MSTLFFFPVIVIIVGAIVLRFIPPDNFKLALLTLELEFVKAKGKTEQVRSSSLVLDPSDNSIADAVLYSCHSF